MLYIFDWDGTLADSRSHIVAALQATIEIMRLEARSDEACASIIGLGLTEAALVLYPELDESQVGIFCTTYSENFLALERGAYPLTLFDKASDTLETLRSQGHTLAVATGKSRRGLNRVLATLGISDWFAATRAADETASKPHPKMLLEILGETGFHANESFMVGDSSYDMEMAQRIDMPRIAATYGVHDKEHLAGYDPDFFIDDIQQLLKC